MLYYRVKQEPVGLLSGGQRQALTLLMATYNIQATPPGRAHRRPGPRHRRKGAGPDPLHRGRKQITCLTITHNLQSALDLGNRTLMMNQGQVIYDVTGEERAKLTIPDLTDKFRQASGKALDNDRMLLGINSKGK